MGSLAASVLTCHSHITRPRLLPSVSKDLQTKPLIVIPEIQRPLLFFFFSPPPQKKKPHQLSLDCVCSIIKKKISIPFLARISPLPPFLSPLLILSSLMIGPGRKSQPENHLPDKKRVEVYSRNFKTRFEKTKQKRKVMLGVLCTPTPAPGRTLRHIFMFCFFVFR